MVFMQINEQYLIWFWMTALVPTMSQSYYSINCGKDYVYSLSLDIMCNSYDSAMHTLVGRVV
jgi:hypothetical protein